MRRAAIKVLPLLVVLWAAFIVFGGALRLVEKAEPTEDSPVKAIAGFCATFVALAAGAYVVRAVAPRLGFFIKRTLARRYSPWAAASAPAAYGLPPPPGPPILHLLQILRT